ncbi:arsenical pump membrane protein [Hamadaea flava]|uniref:SLC13 family permease n=1 Tax=Hamadaea flava TaxID=1742688 RepID=A0ABV8LYJ8_9ACTN|nr:arsenical pump membrane protein [Hamadaea flava]
MDEDLSATAAAAPAEPISAATPAHPRGLLGRLSGMDWLAIALLVAGGLATATGLLPARDASETLERILPILIFLFSVVILAELTAEAEVFDVIAARVTIAARGSNVALFWLCLAFAALTTMFLNLDTTAVLLTPVMLATAVRAGVAPLPLAMTTVWLANTASLLLPVSNLTNLLAASRVKLSPVAFAERMALPQLAAIVVVAGCLWIFYWRRNPPRYTPPSPHRAGNRPLFWVASVCCAVFITGLLLDVPLAYMTPVCAAVLVAAFAKWGRRHLRWSLIPWRLVVFVTGLFLVVETVGQHGLDSMMTSLIGTDPGATGTWRAAIAGGGFANILNNLPSYVAGEAVIPEANHTQGLGLLIGTNVGPLITPWASLATLIWAEHCRNRGVAIDWRKFVLTGAATAAAVLAASVAVLIVT